MKNLSELRENYALHTLDESDVDRNPYQQFERWFQEAMDSEVREPNAMTLATVNYEHRPSVRTVLLKGVDAGGFVFFTNYESRKGQDLLENPSAALLFCWLDLQRQVRIEGHVERISAAESEAYFQSRPKESQIGAWASPQSHVIANRSVIDQKQQALSAQYAEAPVLPLPPFWGGYRLKPDCMEFWQGRLSRLHDRIQYRLDDGNWMIERLAP